MEQKDYFKVGLTVLEHITKNFPDFPPTAIINSKDFGVIIERCSEDKKRLCEIMIVPYQNGIKIEITNYLDLKVQTIKDIENDDELKTIDDFWSFAL